MLRPLKTPRPRPSERGVTHVGISARSIRQVIEPGQFAAAAERYERYFFLRPRFKPHGGTSRNIEAHAESGGPVELHRLVDLEEMEVRSDLDRSVAGIQSLQFDRAAARIKINAAVARSDDTGVFRIGRRARRRADWLVDCHKLGTIGQHALDLNNIHHSGDAGQY